MSAFGEKLTFAKHHDLLSRALARKRHVAAASGNGGALIMRSVRDRGSEKKNWLVSVKQAASLALIVLAAVGNARPADVEPPVPPPDQYVFLALDKLEQEHVNRQRVDWKAIRDDIGKKAHGISTLDEAHRLIEQVIGELGETHTFLVASRAPATSPPSSAPNPIPVIVSARLGSAGYLDIPTFAASESTRSQDFANRLRSIAATLSKQEICGWIIDLRHNQGGNMTPALLALGPLMGEGLLGGAIGARVPQFWHFDRDSLWIADKISIQGISRIDDDPGAQVVQGAREIIHLDHALQIKKLDLPIAVLIGGRTASSGEGIAIILLGSKEAKSFGAQSAGLTSANIGAKMPDGALLVITVGYLADRNGKTYTSGINPSEPVAGSSADKIPLEADVEIKHAQTWLESTQACRAFRAEQPRPSTSSSRGAP